MTADKLGNILIIVGGTVKINYNKFINPKGENKMSYKISLKHKNEIKQRLDEMGVFDQDALIDLVERWRFSEFVGKFSMGLAYHTFMNVTQEQIKSRDFEVEKIKDGVNDYANGLGRKFYQKIIWYHGDGNYAQAAISSPLLLWVSTLDPSGLISLGDYLLDIYATPFYDDDDKALIISSAQEDSGSIIKNFRERIKDFSALSEIFDDEFSEKKNTLELLENMKALFDEDGVSKKGAESIFTRRHSVLCKAILDVSDDVTLSTFVTSKTEVTQTLDVFIEFLGDFFNIEDNNLWVGKEGVLGRYDKKLGDLLEKATVSSANLYHHVKSIMAEDAMFAAEFSLDGWKNVIENMDKGNAVVKEPLGKLGAIQILVCSGAVGGEFADEMASLVQECFIEAFPEVEEMKRISKGAIKKVIVALSKENKIRGL